MGLLGMDHFGDKLRNFYGGSGYKNRDPRSGWVDAWMDK